MSLSSYLQKPERRYREKRLMSANIQDAPTVCKSCQWGGSMRDESGTGFTLEMSPGVATAGAGESHRE